ncbi:hypothetical protein PIB30_051345 [Stylosanthes scabra]|uniref:Uncharacterized protein n=1 Tax=Stylosanthes scabra TaxID=79078 RepID=A0ABU6XIE3_9FABA|nr:hypothetical protein [Stylosanthes scabra]
MTAANFNFSTTRRGGDEHRAFSMNGGGGGADLRGRSTTVTNYHHRIISSRSQRQWLQTPRSPTTTIASSLFNSSLRRLRAVANGDETAAVKELSQPVSISL